MAKENTVFKKVKTFDDEISKFDQNIGFKILEDIRLFERSWKMAGADGKLLKRFDYKIIKSFRGKSALTHELF